MDDNADVDEIIRSLLVTVPDFPRAGINFIDITPVLEKSPAAFRELIERMCAPHRAGPPDAVVCIDAMGFVVGAPVAYELGSRIVMARRPGKLPRPTIEVTYDMDYDQNRRLHMHAGAIVSGSRVLIVDDFLAAGGTVLAAVNLVERSRGKVVGVSVAFELARLKAREKIERRGIPLHAAFRV